MTTEYKCSICGKEIDAEGDWKQGHSAAPVTNGRCCSRCNCLLVIPVRIELALNKHNGESK